jgi:hypothetical protein
MGLAQSSIDCEFAVIYLHTLTTFTFLHCCLDSTFLAYDQFPREFRTTVELCEAIMSENPEPIRRVGLTLDSGIAPTLT